jgi:hypothetical protein
MSLLGDAIVPVGDVAQVLSTRHYLGPATRGFAWSDEFGVLVLAGPTSRNLPPDRWLELTRWCLTGGPNAGSRQWATVRRWLVANRPDVTTVVSYSDPSVGHTGALYRACGWLWAPTWHRLRPPPTGNGAWIDGEAQSVKDRWVCPLRPDSEREAILAVRDAAVVKVNPDAEYREPCWRRGRPIGGGGQWRPL